MDWLAKILGLPEEFYNCSEGPGGGLIQVGDIPKQIQNIFWYNSCFGLDDK